LTSGHSELSPERPDVKNYKCRQTVKRQLVPDNCSCDEEAPPSEPSCSSSWNEQIAMLGPNCQRQRLCKQCYWSEQVQCLRESKVSVAISERGLDIKSTIFTHWQFL